MSEQVFRLRAGLEAAKPQPAGTEKRESKPTCSHTQWQAAALVVGISSGCEFSSHEAHQALINHV
jgi:hypothetical protein